MSWPLGVKKASARQRCSTCKKIVKKDELLYIYTGRKELICQRCEDKFYKEMNQWRLKMQGYYDV
jgi:hypothetical protein